MKTVSSKITLLLFAVLFLSGSAYAQLTRTMQNYRSPDKLGLNVFEAPKTTDVPFEGLNVRIGGAYALQFQGLRHENSGAVQLIDIGDNFNLATANLDLDVALYDGVRLFVRTYLTSRRHPETFVQGGYMLVDKLDFIEEGFLSELMQYVTIRIGHMEVNYGDTHFRRSDNAQVLYNPFIGNYIMDSFTTEVGGEVYFRKDGFLAMVGVTNGKLNQGVDNPGATNPSLLGKLGYDSQVNEDLRIRLTGSIYHNSDANGMFLYDGDRAGSRYYLVMEAVGAKAANQFTSGRVNPRLENELTAIMINPFVKYKGLEFFGVLEFANGRDKGETSDRNWTQIGLEGLYRFGLDEKFYVGARYNYVDGEENSINGKVDFDRINIGGGWFLTNNILTKIEYVKQNYNGFDTTSIFRNGEFDGIMLEAVISF